jgi:prevent-host-death family protein
VKVETVELENHLKQYLDQIRSTGEPITVCQGNEPVAILAPVAPSVKKNGANMIDRLLDSPWPVKDFTPLTRADIYERQ